MKRRLVVGILAGTLGLASLTGCKATEQFKDAPVQNRNVAGASVGTMPDGFSNFATKCDHGNRVYVIFHQDGHYGSISVVPQDPSCR